MRTVGGVIDYAKIFSADDKRDVEVAAGQAARNSDTDFFVVTVNDRSGIWAERGSHFAMVAKVVGDVERAVSKHFGRRAPLTVLLVFKSTVVLHLRTSRDDLSKYLIFRNFYGGAKAALKSIRQQGEAHAQAALRYIARLDMVVDDLNHASEGGGLTSKLQKAHFWAFQQEALLTSRELIQSPSIDWLHRAFSTVIVKSASLVTWFGVPSWIGFLAIMGALFIVVLWLGHMVEAKVPPAGPVLNQAIRVVYALPLLMLYAVSQGDLENLLYISQQFDGDLMTFLGWSVAISDYSWPIPFWIIVSGAIIAAALEATNRILGLRNSLRQSSNDVAIGATGTGANLVRTVFVPVKIYGLVSETFVAAAWIVSLVIWPGIIAAYFFVISIGKRVIELWGVVRANPSRQIERHVANSVSPVRIHNGVARHEI